jgi:hypothetical protein
MLFSPASKMIHIYRIVSSLFGFHLPPLQWRFECTWLCVPCTLCVCKNWCMDMRGISPVFTWATVCISNLLLYQRCTSIKDDGTSLPQPLLNIVDRKVMLTVTCVYDDIGWFVLMMHYVVPFARGIIGNQHIYSIIDKIGKSRLTFQIE